LEQIGLFAHRMGVKIFAGQGKVQIQAQSDAMELIAQAGLKIISTTDLVHISAAKEVVINAGGSYIKIGSAGIEQGTMAKWQVFSSSHSMSGPASMQPSLPPLPQDAVQFSDSFCVRDFRTGDPIDKMRYLLTYDDGTSVKGITGPDGLIPRQTRLNPDKVKIELLGVVH
jgi:type VI secretion system secreted protein VgrG